jgi:DNA-binding CsgD family transcriptional regulator/tetratricopeptide (TPR) repeat protein
VLLVEGSAGIGKTTLLAAATEFGRRAGVRVLRCTGRELERDFPFGVVRQLFDRVVRADGEGERQRLLDGAEAAAPVLGLAGGGSGSEYAALHGLYWLTANLAQDGPVLIVADDAHWGDQASLRFLSFLAGRVAELPVLLVLAARPEEWQPEAIFGSTASELVGRSVIPRPLTREACSTLLCDRLGKPVDARFTDACHHATGGNPFLLLALVEAVLADGALPSVAAIDELRPSAVTRSIAARLGRLSGDARTVAQSVAILGDDAELHAIATLANLPVAGVRVAVQELAQASILARGEHLRFHHPLVGSAVHADIPLGEREDRHRAAARLLEANDAKVERTAAQLLATSPAGDPHTCEVMRAAARAALAVGASHSAVAYLRRALAEPVPGNQRGELLTELGFAERYVNADVAIQHLREALDLVTERDRYAEIAAEIADVLIYTLQAPEAVATAEAALARLTGEQTDVRRRLQAAVIFANALDSETAPEAVRAITELGKLAPEPGLGARRLQAEYLYARMAVRAEPSRDLAAEAERLLADDLIIQQDRAGVAFLSAIITLIEADAESTVMWLDRAFEVARRDGDGYALLGCLSNACRAHLRRGQLADAVAMGREAIDLQIQWGNGLGLPFPCGQVAEAQLAAGDYDGAERTLMRATVAEGRLPDQVEMMWHYYRSARARLLMAHGDVRGSLHAMLDAGRRFEPANGLWIGWRGWAAACLTALDEDREQALALMHEELELARRWGAPGPLGEALRVHGLVQRDQAGEESLREAVAVLDGSICKLDHARALVELGAMLRRSGRRREARGPLQQGLELAVLCGAHPLTERAEIELRAAGATPRSAIRGGVDALTTSERRVAEMAADGMSNKQLAQALFVTVKTVETHLHRAFQKLDVSSRTELSAALEHESVMTNA